MQAHLQQHLDAEAARNREAAAVRQLADASADPQQAALLAQPVKQLQLTVRGCPEVAIQRNTDERITWPSDSWATLQLTLSMLCCWRSPSSAAAHTQLS